MTFPKWLEVAALCAGLTAGACGCNNARIVRWDSMSGVGVVAIPHNDNSWPDKNREHAEELIKQSCPHGYQIIDEKVTVVGEEVDRSVQRVGYMRFHETSVHPVTEYHIIFRSNDAPAPLLTAPAVGVAVPTRTVVPLAPPPGPSTVVTPVSSPGGDLPPAPVPVGP